MNKRDWDADWAMCEAATPGPWWWRKWGSNDGYDGLFCGENGHTCLLSSGIDSDHCLYCSDSDAHFIAEARSALPYWLQRVKEMEDALRLAYRALTEGMADVPAGERSPKCSELWVEAKRRIREVLNLEL